MATKNKDLSVSCRLAIEELQRTRRNISRFWNLLYALSAFAVAGLIVAICSVVFGSSGAAIAGGVGTVVSSGGALFVVRLKNAARREHERAQNAVRKDCVGVPNSATTRGEAGPGGAGIEATDVERVQLVGTIESLLDQKDR